MRPERQRLIRSLFDKYIEMYASRDPRLTEEFSENFSGYTGGGDFLVRDRNEWVKITCQDFSQVTGRIDIEMLDLSMQDLSTDIVLVTAFFHIRLPIPDHFLARETARLVLVFRLESGRWMIVHSGISIPYSSVGENEVYPIRRLEERNRELEALVEERTRKLEEANEKLEVQSNTDWLTGISNRRSFDWALKQEWNRASRSGLPLGLIILDVDLFKHFNDIYGHLAGDDCLRELALALARTVRRAGDLVARFGGEEFAVLLPNTGAPQALEVSRKIQREVSSLALPHADTPPGIVTFSLGVACVKISNQINGDDLVRQADVALYRAKRSGRNCALLATESETLDEVQEPGSR
jgi:diguanylate cyclase (GGDEF)-like protein